MPSRARIRARDRMLPEINNIIEAHTTIRRGKKGRDKHKSILRGSVLLLCAAWELYCERVVQEAAMKIARHARTHNDLPEAVKMQLKLAVHDVNPHLSDPLRLAGNGWRVEYIKIARKKCTKLNTPNSNNIDDLFKHCLGKNKISACWSHGAEELNKFVKIRGEIAHMGSDSRPIDRDQVKHFKAIVQKTISDTDDELYNYFKSLPYYAKAPWQKTQK